MKIDFGCGVTKKEGFIGVDCLPLKGVDIIHDLQTFPYPFENNEVDEIWMDNVLEHIPNPLKVIEELHRICKNGAKIIIAVPYFRSMYAFIDPTHVNFFGVNWFNYFDPNHAFQQKYQYSKATFSVDKIMFNREWHDQNAMSFFMKRLVNFAEKRPETYESRLSHLFPLDSLTFYLTVKKE